MLHERRKTFRHCFIAAVLLLICLQRLDNNEIQVYTGVTAIPLFLVEGSKARCYDIEAIQDTIIKIYYKAPRMYEMCPVLVDLVW